MPWVIENYAASNWTEFEATGYYTEVGYWVDGYCQEEWMIATDPASEWIPV